MNSIVDKYQMVESLATAFVENNDDEMDVAFDRIVHAAVMAERAQCIKDTCAMCRGDYGDEYDKAERAEEFYSGPIWYHVSLSPKDKVRMNNFRGCVAALIHERLFQAAQREEAR